MLAKFNLVGLESHHQSTESFEIEDRIAFRL